jgi:AcrR family transcriptional regulator
MNGQAKPTLRGRGRPRTNGVGESVLVTREAIIDLAYTQAQTSPLSSVSFVQLAKELGVVPGSLHYHIGTKDDLNSAILNRFYKDLLKRLRNEISGGSWRDRISSVAWILLESWRQHRGAAEHIQTRARYRVFQKVREGEQDYGAVFLDHVFTLFKEAGFTAHQTALFYHTLALHCLASANSDSGRLEPAVHGTFLKQRAETNDSARYPGLGYALTEFADIRSDEAFRLGLAALLDRFATERS